MPKIDFIKVILNKIINLDTRVDNTENRLDSIDGRLQGLHDKVDIVHKALSNHIPTTLKWNRRLVLLSVMILTPIFTALLQAYGGKLASGLYDAIIFILKI